MAEMEQLKKLRQKPRPTGAEAVGGMVARERRRHGQRLTARGSLRAFALIVAVLVTIVPTAAAQERALNQGHPVRLDDAYPIAAGDATLLLDSGVQTQAHRANRGAFLIDTQYAIMPNTQLSLGTVLTTTPHKTSDPGSGDLGVAARVLLGREATFLPTMATQVSLGLPTGAGSRSVDVELKGLVTRTATLGLLPLAFHLNGAAQFRATHLGSDERLLRYHLVAGSSLVVPQQATTTLVGDVFADEALTRGQAATVGVELGFRHRLGPRVAFDGAVGTEVTGPRDRSPFFARVGLSIDFDLPAFRKPPP